MPRIYVREKTSRHAKKHPGNTTRKFRKTKIADKQVHEKTREYYCKRARIKKNLMYGKLHQIHDKKSRKKYMTCENQEEQEKLRIKWKSKVENNKKWLKNTSDLLADFETNI